MNGKTAPRTPYFINKLHHFYRRFPTQLWILFLGSFIISVGSSMSWPFLNIYLRERLALPLHMTTLLISIRAASGIISSFTIGAVADRFGRRWIMLISVGSGFLYYVLMAHANSIWEFALLMGIWGALELFFSVGSNAMIADLTDKENQLEAFSLQRMMHNTGIAVGPIIGGILAARSYTLNFYCASIGYFFAFILLVFTVKESLPPELRSVAQPVPGAESATKLSDVLKDRVFLLVIFFVVMITIGTSAVFNLLPLYAREVYGISESRISIVFTINAILCVTLQMPALRLTNRHNPFYGMIAGAAFYAVGISGYALFPSVLWYCICMAIMTIGEVLVSPTVLALTARRAPVDARGRYMGIYNLAYPIGYAIGPALAGDLFDRFAPKAIWINGGLFSLIALFGFTVLYWKNRDQAWMKK